MNQPPSLPLKIWIAIPVFNDWECLLLLLKKIDSVFQEKNFALQILILDDASPIPCPNIELSSFAFQRIEKICLLKLARNLGHQRAIAIGLAYLEATSSLPVLIMDADGEDKPEDALRLAENFVPEKKEVIFARRVKRSEGILFRLFYYSFKKIYRTLTGYPIDFGNFSIIHPEVLKRMVCVAELWNHYPASIIKAKIPYSTIPSERGTRLVGKSKMNLISLILHGLSALSVSGDVVGARALLASFFLSILSFVMILLVVSIRIFTTWAIPGWASYLVSSFTIILIQSVILSLFFVFMILQGRNYSSFIPKREYEYYILECQELYPR